MINLKFNLQKRENTYGITIIKTKLNNTALRCLIDTGARIPVWCSGEDELKAQFPQCVKMDAVFLLSGFGKEYEFATVYCIPNFILSDGKSKIYYHNMVVAVVNRDFSFDMILSYSIFNKMNVSINTFTNRNGLHSVTPNVKISAYKEHFNVVPIHKNLSAHDLNPIKQKFGIDNILDSVCIFVQK